MAASEFALGDFVRVDDVVVGVLAWHEWQGLLTSSTGSYFIDSTGPEHTFVIVDLTLVNAGDAPFLIEGTRGSFVIELKDSEDRTYSPVNFYGVRRSQGLELYPVATGERISGEVAFKVPLDAEGLMLTFTGDLGKAFFALGPGPESVDPPGHIPGQAEVVVHILGDTLEVGAVALTVHGVSFSARSADPGFRFAVLDYSVRNVSKESINLEIGRYFGDNVSISVKDSQGFIYGINQRFAETSAQTPEGNFAPGERKRGSIIFEVPQDAEGLIAVFQPPFSAFSVSDSFWTDRVLIELPDADNEG